MKPAYETAIAAYGHHKEGAFAAKVARAAVALQQRQQHLDREHMKAVFFGQSVLGTIRQCVVLACQSDSYQLTNALLKVGHTAHILYDIKRERVLGGS